MYEVINKKLGIKACGLADLTAQQMSHFLGQWEEGATIGTLTLFFENNTGNVVLNRDNANYEFYLELTEGYLGATEEERRELREKCPESVKETINVLEGCLRVRATKQQMKLLNHRQNIDEEYDISHRLLCEIEKTYSNSNPRLWMFKAFQFGVIQGKRIERAKKRQSVIA